MQETQSDVMMDLVRTFLNDSGEKHGFPKLSSDTIEGVYAYAYQFYEHGKYDEASRFFRFLTLIETGKKRHWMGLGAALQMLKNYEEAIHAYSVAAIIDENDPFVHVYAADCFFVRGQVDKGIEALNSAETVAKRQKKFEKLIPEIGLIRSAWIKQLKEKKDV